jgi:hypothetical protein
MKKSLMVAAVLVCATAMASTNNGFGVSVLVGDTPRPEYCQRGTTYIEALRGANFGIRITNPTPYRVAVALSVDGLNTIDAKHTDPRDAAKWVLGPYESTVIPGWQVNGETARSFFFTGERNSYGAALGQTANLGVIEAVFYREKHREISFYAPRAEGANKNAAGAPATAQAAPSEDYAATGMGSRTDHEVETVDIDLESRPAASIRLRYEFRPQLVRLGVLPAYSDPIERRERARGFESYCPEVH